MTTRKTIYLLLTFLITFTGCSQGEHVNVYSSRHYDTDLDLYRQFTEQTGIEINLIEGGSDELIERIKNEGLNSPADIVVTVDAGRLWRAKEAGVLQPLSSDVLEERIPAEFREPEGYWFGLSQRIRGIVYNRDRVSPDDLQGYLELADEKWDGRVCVRSSSNIYNQSLVASMIETYGEQRTEEWANGLVSNFARDPQGGDTDQILAVAGGQCDVALANHYYLARLIEADSEADREAASRVDIYFPPSEHGGTHVNVSGAGLAANAPNRENAVRFLEYLTEPQAQELYVGGNYEYSAIEGVEPSGVLEEFGSFESDAVNVSYYGINNPDALRLMDRAGWR
ncbi:MAG: Fe(3+) ABC transporter substrate-binding protein [Balneolaceae bacterium]